jgi:hypothetical protein
VEPIVVGAADDGDEKEYSSSFFTMVDGFCIREQVRTVRPSAVDGSTDAVIGIPDDSGNP